MHKPLLTWLGKYSKGMCANHWAIKNDFMEHLQSPDNHCLLLLPPVPPFQGSQEFPLEWGRGNSRAWALTMNGSINAIHLDFFPAAATQLWQGWWGLFWNLFEADMPKDQNSPSPIFLSDRSVALGVLIWNEVQNRNSNKILICIQQDHQVIFSYFCREEKPHISLQMS